MSSWDESDTRRMCQCLHDPPARATFLCQDCTDETRYLCQVCHGRHSGEEAAAAHRVITIGEYMREPSKYHLAGDDTCEKHPEKRYELICQYCNMFLCAKCLGDKTVVCLKAPTGVAKHDPVALEYGVDELKSDLNGSGEKAEKISTRAGNLIGKVRKMRREAATLLSENIDGIEAERVHIHVKVDGKMDHLRTTAEDHMNAQMQEMSELEESLQRFLDDKTKQVVLAKEVLDCPVPLEVHRAVPGLSARLEEPLPLVSLPDPPVLQLVKTDVQQLEAMLDSIRLTFSTDVTTSDGAPPSQSRGSTSSKITKTPASPDLSTQLALHTDLQRPLSLATFDTLSTGTNPASSRYQKARSVVSAAYLPVGSPASRFPAPVTPSSARSTTSSRASTSANPPAVPSRSSTLRSSTLQPAMAPSPSLASGHPSMTRIKTVSYLTLPVLPNGQVPWECAYVEKQGKQVLMEAACPYGLLMVGGSGRRKDVGWKGEGSECVSVCSSEDGKHCYCIRGATEGRAQLLQLYTFGEDGASHLTLEEEVGLATNPSGGSVCYSADRLAVVSREKRRITLHSSRSLRRVSTIEGVVDGVRLLGDPRFASWDPSGGALYVCDWGRKSVPKSVACLRLSSPPCVVWRTGLEDPWAVSFIRGRVYVTQANASKVTVLSAADGHVEETITCSGKARGVREDGRGSIEVMSYVSE